MNQERMGKFISEMRKKQNLTQKDIAEKLGVSINAVSKWERGICMMDISQLKPLSKILNVSITEIINGEKIQIEDAKEKTDKAIENTITYANKKISSSRIKTIFLILLIVLLTSVIIYVGYKSYAMSKYYIKPLSKEEYGSRIEPLKKQSEIKIYKRTIDENKYIKIDDIKLRNDFDNYKREELNELNAVKFNKYEDDKIISGLWLGSMETYIDIFTSEDIIVFGEGNYDFTKVDRKYLLLKKDINNDIDLINYIKDNYYLKNNIFTTIREMKENYAINMFTDISIPKTQSLTIISGDYTGYIFNINNNIKEANILRNNKRYIFTFVGEFATDEYIKDLLSTLEIE